MILHFHYSQKLWPFNEELIKTVADYFVVNGLKDAGYEYIVIDDCWSEKQRDENGRLVPDKNKFPNGIKPVADYVHSKGLKFGIYSCAGTHTCAGYPGSFEHEFDDAETFADRIKSHFSQYSATVGFCLR